LTASEPTRLMVLVNPQARGNRRDPVSAEAVSELLGPEASFVVTPDFSAVAGIAARLLDSDLDLLIVSGGDGTLHLLLTELLRRTGGDAGPIPPILLLRGGTMNMAAANLSTTRSPLMELRVLSHVLRRRTPAGRLPVRTVSPLRIEADGIAGPLFGLVFANGIAFRILNEYYQGTPSVTRAFNVTASIIAGAFMSRELEQRYFCRLPATVRVDGTVVGRRDLRISVASAVPRLLLWFTIFEQQPLSAGEFYFLANFMKTREIARNFWALCRGPFEAPRHVNRTARRVEMHGAGGFTVDGEVYSGDDGSDRCEIVAGPPVRFVDLSGFALPGYTWSDPIRSALDQAG